MNQSVGTNVVTWLGVYALSIEQSCQGVYNVP
jgi:hypothetical protein